MIITPPQKMEIHHDNIIVNVFIRIDNNINYCPIPSHNLDLQHKMHFPKSVSNQFVLLQQVLNFNFLGRGPFTLSDSLSSTH